MSDKKCTHYTDLTEINVNICFFAYDVLGSPLCNNTVTVIPLFLCLWWKREFLPRQR